MSKNTLIESRPNFREVILCNANYQREKKELEDLGWMRKAMGLPKISKKEMKKLIWEMDKRHSDYSQDFDYLYFTCPKHGQGYYFCIEAKNMTDEEFEQHTIDYNNYVAEMNRSKAG